MIILGPFLMTFMVALFVDLSIADMYNWVDENGVAHFSDTPPDDTDNSDIETLPTYTTLENNGYPKVNDSTKNENSNNRSNLTDTVQKNTWV